MTDTALKEKNAENEIASVLARRGLLIAKPYFDQRGADLLAFLRICGGAKFCRVQSKYRQEESAVAIPFHYVPGAFVCFVYLVPKPPDSADPPQHALYCFFPDDIRQWPLSDGQYRLCLPKFTTCSAQFAASQFNDSTFDRLSRLIAELTIQDEMVEILDFSNPNNSGLIALL
jgi:hypothetical protein